MPEQDNKDLGFAKIPNAVLLSLIQSEAVPLSQRVLLCLFLKAFDERKSERDKLTISYVARVVGSDRRSTERAFKAIAKVYPFEIEHSGNGRKNIIKYLSQPAAELPHVGKNNLRQSCPQPAAKMPHKPAAKMPHKPAAKMPHKEEEEKEIKEEDFPCQPYGSTDLDEFYQTVGVRWAGDD